MLKAEMPTFVLPLGILLLLVLAIGLIYAREHFLKHWMPAVVAGLFLAGIVPFANEIYWRRQKDFEICAQDREKRYELLGSVAKTYTNLFKIHTRLTHLSNEQATEDRALRRMAKQRKASKDVMQVYISRLTALNAERSELYKERSRLESQLGGDSALISRFYSQDVLRQYDQLASSYDRRISEVAPFIPTQDNPVVKSVFQLVGVMAEQAKEKDRECK